MESSMPEVMKELDQSHGLGHLEERESSMGANDRELVLPKHRKIVVARNSNLQVTSHVKLSFRVY